MIEAVCWGARVPAGDPAVPDPGRAIGSRPLISPRIRPETAGGPPPQAPWTVHLPSSTLGEPIESREARTRSATISAPIRRLEIREAKFRERTAAWWRRNGDQVATWGRKT